ncbi:MAG TPA: MMPL family transporter [Bacteroidia bacterium]|nr:MMPL family transporter [Bacteroidia bacterium]HNT79243.1 MMPL family transporter [Bacteroidia bacterium]
MFRRLAYLILRYRLWILTSIILLTGVMAFVASKVELSYEFAKVLPANDPYSRQYEEFKKLFGEDGSVMVLGIEDKNLFELERFNKWQALSDKITSIDGIEAVVSVAHLYVLERNDEELKFEVKPLFKEKPISQTEMDSLRSVLESLPFYKGFIHNAETNASLMAITFERSKLNTKQRFEIINSIKDRVAEYEKESNTDVHISGLPYIRTVITQKIAEELKLFLFLALLVTAIILLVFFRSLKSVIFSLGVVLIGVVWSLGSMVLFGYKITALSGIIPPLIIIIGIPNCILLLNKYYNDFLIHGNKTYALARTIQRIGFTTFLANVTTAIGFGVFYFTKSKILMEFGVIAAINVMFTYALSLCLIPIIFSYLQEPKIRHTKHLEQGRTSGILNWIDHIVHHKYKSIFAIVILVSVVFAFGASKINTIGFVVDDLPEDDQVYVDLKFFEKSFNGVLPLEITINTLQEGGVLKISTLSKLHRLNKELSQYTELSRSLSVVDAVKYAYQTYRDGDPKYYILPGTFDLSSMADYLGEMKSNSNMFRSFIDSSKSIARVSVQMADVGSVRMNEMVNELKSKLDTIFPADKYETHLTGNSLIFLKGNDYLFKNLRDSILLAIFLISVIMITLFMSMRMIAVSILPSLIPLLITAGMMGFFNINLKPSTILIFSIAFGISSDQTIYFLTKYRQEIKFHTSSISQAVSKTINETGFSMIYTAIILFCGFFIFSASQFGGTAALGKLISFTLLVSMMSNLILMPAFLVALEKRLTTKAFLEEPLVEILDDESDLEIDRQQLDDLGTSINKSNTIDT